MEADRQIVIVGTGQMAWHETNIERTPVAALRSAAEAALADVGYAKVAADIDAVAMVRFIAGADAGMAALFPKNPGADVAHQLGITAKLYQGTIGGNTPQYLVNRMADKLASGEHRAVLIAGAEVLSTMFNALAEGQDISSWAGPAADEPETLGVERDGLLPMEQAHGLFEPINTYPLFETSLRHARGADADSHSQRLAQLCSRMSEVAAAHPQAWRPESLSADQVGTVSRSNRYVGYPYTRVMNAVLAVDQAAALVMTTASQARAWGVPEEHCIYLRSGASANDIWHVSQRPVLHESPAIAKSWEAVSGLSGVPLDEVTDFDLYSCFPSAVQVACDAIGLDPFDERGVTVTGGLPFFGGPGNNYTLHSIATMVDRLRARGEGNGLVTAIGLYLTKHSMGLYSTSPGATGWQPADDAQLQADVDAGGAVAIAEDPNGPMKVEAYTVAYNREGPRKAIALGRNGNGERVLAITQPDEPRLLDLVTNGPVGQTVQVSSDGTLNTFSW